MVEHAAITVAEESVYCNYPRCGYAIAYKPEERANAIEQMHAHQFILKHRPEDSENYNVHTVQPDVDLVNRPPHYLGHPAGIECIHVIEHATSFNLGTAIKYIWRVMWGDKGNAIQDLEKARWYITREIEKRNAAL